MSIPIESDGSQTAEELGENTRLRKPKLGITTLHDATYATQGTRMPLCGVSFWNEGMYSGGFGVGRNEEGGGGRHVLP